MRVAAATDDLTVDYDDLERQLSDRTRVVAFALASNATGSVADAKRICALAREAGAISWIDAVHYAAHEPIDVAEIGCDVLLCSPYKFCGPHLGIAYVRRELAETLAPVQGAAVGGDAGRPPFETGTLPYELLAGFSATIAYLDSIGGHGGDPRLRARARRAPARRACRSSVTLYGPQTMDGRVPTFLFNVDGVPADRRRAPARRARHRRSGTPTTGTASRSARACRSSRCAPGSRTTTRATRSTGCSTSLPASELQIGFS